MIYSYIDPGTGSMLISATIALISVAFFMIKGFIYRKFNISGEKGQSIDPNKHYDLVFYSEGKQYWNVFKPLVIECADRGIAVTFLTSDKNDPALNANLNGIETIYIGSGLESYFSLNRLRANVVVMTTPGLDLLEIKRSKNVAHYVHLTHAPRCVAGYKAYALDYFDSVLIGGEGDVDVIRFFEKLRDLPKKEIQVIGHTYVDVYREILRERNYDYSMFNERRTTILVSPTWSNHGLLTKYGKTLLQKLVDIDTYNIIVRPHPQSVLTEKEMLEELQSLFPNSENLIWDTDIENLRAMAHADIMISDFSGNIFDFFVLFNKPILTMSSNYEKRGRDVIDMPEDPWDIKTLNKLGATLNSEDIDNLPAIIEETIKHYGQNNSVAPETVAIFNKYPNESGVRGVDFIEHKLKEFQATSPVESFKSSASSSSNEQEVFNAEISNNKKTWLANFINSILNPRFFYQCTVASVLLLAYIFIALNIFPNDGLNYEVFIRILPYSFVLIGVCFTITLLLVIFMAEGKFSFHKEMQSLDLRNVFLTAIPLSPILVYISSNQDILSMGSSLYVFFFFFSISIIVVVILPWLLNPILDKNFSKAVGLAVLFTAFNMASFGRTTPIKQVTLVLAGMVLVVFLALFIKQKKTLMFIAVIFLSTNLGVSVMSQEKPEVIKDSDKEISVSPIVKYTQGKDLKKSPDVFFLVYDAYANQETLETYGYDNQEQINFLLDDGFTIYDGTYTIAPASISSMARMIDAQEVQGGTEELRTALAGYGSGFVTFKEKGYTTQSVHTSDYMTKDIEPIQDFAFPDGKDSIGAHKIIIDAVIEGEFRFVADFSTTTYDDFKVAKRKALTNNSKESKFHYSHSDYPGHSQNSGVLRPNETELHFGWLDTANIEMREDIAAIRSMNRDAIIIVAGDHGPYLTKNGIGLDDEYPISEIDALDIQDRFGAFLAISWPEKDAEEKYNIEIIQDILPAVISYVYDDASSYESFRMSKDIILKEVIGGTDIVDGTIVGGADDGKPLFKKYGRRSR